MTDAGRQDLHEDLVWAWIIDCEIFDRDWRTGSAGNGAAGFGGHAGSSCGYGVNVGDAAVWSSTRSGLRESACEVCEIVGIGIAG